MKKNDYYAVDGLIDSISMIKTMAVLYNQEVGIHTFELKSDFQTAKGESQLQQVWNVLKAGKSQGKRLIRLTNGLWAEMIYPIREEWSQPFLKIVVNPRVLVDGQEGYLGIKQLWQADTYDKVADQWETSILRKVRNDFVKIGVSPAAIRGNTQTRFLPCLSAMVTYVLKESGKLI